MNGTYRSLTLAVALAAPLAGLPAHAADEDLPSLDEVMAQTQVARDWIEGKLSDYNMPKVTYTGDPITMRFTSHIPETSATVKRVDRPGFALLEKLTDGKIKVQMRHGGTVHKVKEGMAALRNGLSDFTNCFSTYEPKSFDMVHVMALPGIFPTNEIATQAGQELAPKYFTAEYARHGVDLTYTRATTDYVYFSKEPIRTLEDLKGKKVRSSGGTHAEVQKLLGAVPTSVPSPQIYTSLQRGVIDVVSLTDAIIGVFKIYELAKYRTFTDLSRNSLEKCMRPGFFADLPADLQNIVSRFMPVLALAESQITYRVAGALAVEKFRKAGMKFESPSADEQKRWHEAVRPLIEDFKAGKKAKGLPVDELFADIARLKARYAGMSPNDITSLAIREPSEVLSTLH